MKTKSASKRSPWARCDSRRGLKTRIGVVPYLNAMRSSFDPFAVIPFYRTRLSNLRFTNGA